MGIGESLWASAIPAKLVQGGRIWLLARRGIATFLVYALYELILSDTPKIFDVRRSLALASAPGGIEAAENMS